MTMFYLAIGVTIIGCGFKAVTAGSAKQWFREIPQTPVRED